MISKLDVSVRGAVEGYVVVLDKGPRTQRYDRGIYHDFNQNSTQDCCGLD